MMERILPKNRPAVLLAPMAGFTDRTFRLICREFGADLVCTEMISAKGLLYKSDKSRALYDAKPGDEPFFVQLFGSDPDTVAKAAALIEQELGEQLLGIDLNMGCPMPKIAGNGDGCALMQNFLLAAAIIERTVHAVHVPVTVKFRKGWDEAHQNAAAFAKICEQSGACALTIHGRTREQLYAGRADRVCMAEVKQSVQIPVFANGDVTSGQSALETLAETGCDGVMVGRAALGDPFLFEEIRCALSGEAYTRPQPEQRREIALRHARNALEQKGPHAMIELRKHLAFYARSERGAAKLRVRINACRTLEELAEIWPEHGLGADDAP
ncbi:MAG TPA: tRNA dihydrouridine synthase DusB [Feifaniaceae bacterium]|nr:tRNA dihydrouridine synthase DusB [Feifaniaceae bacterium]